jgi:hypothetical protein
MIENFKAKVEWKKSLELLLWVILHDPNARP